MSGVDHNPLFRSVTSSTTLPEQLRGSIDSARAEGRTGNCRSGRLPATVWCTCAASSSLVWQVSSQQGFPSSPGEGAGFFPAVQGKGQVSSQQSRGRGKVFPTAQGKGQVSSQQSRGRGKGFPTAQGKGQVSSQQFRGRGRFLPNNEPTPAGY